MQRLLTSSPLLPETALGQIINRSSRTGARAMMIVSNILRKTPNKLLNASKWACGEQLNDLMVNSIGASENYIQLSLL